MNYYIDKNIKEVSNNDTIGILICKRENKFVIEYCSDERIAVREYELVWYNKYRKWWLWKWYLVRVISLIKILKILF